MSRLVRTLLLTLVAAWLPVTLHCKLEAAGLFAAPDACCASEPTATIPDSDCKDDSCPTVEDTLYKQAARIIKIEAPAASECFACLAWVALLRDTAAAPVLSAPRHDPPPEWRVAWQFVTRAAPPARAPSLNA